MSAPVGPEVEGPVYLVAIHPVDDYESWSRRRVADRVTDNLAGQGVLEYAVYQAVDNPNEVLVALEVESRAAAEALLADPDRMRTHLERAGVDFYPAVFVGRRQERVILPAARDVDESQD